MTRYCMTSLIVVAFLLVGCGGEDPPPKASARDIVGPWFAVDPFDQELIAIEFTDAEKVIMTTRTEMRQFESMTVDYSILNGGRINFVNPAIGISEMVSYEITRDRLILRSADGESTYNFHPAGVKTPQELFSEAWKARLVEHGKQLNEAMHAGYANDTSGFTRMFRTSGRVSETAAQALLNELVRRYGALVRTQFRSESDRDTNDKAAHGVVRVGYTMQFVDKTVEAEAMMHFSTTELENLTVRDQTHGDLRFPPDW